MRAPTRLNVFSKSSDPSPDVKLALNAVKQRLDQKAREANWKGAKRIMAIDAAVQGIGIRAIGVEWNGIRPALKTFRVRPPEWHCDPAAEPHDVLGTSSWCAWRRFVGSDRMLNTIKKFGISPGGAGGDLSVEGDRGITLPDDEILLRGGFEKERTWLPGSRILVTDYYRRDDTMDLYYPCSKCGRRATVGRYNTGRSVRPNFECQHCGKSESKMPARETMRQGLRYPYGRHIRIVGPGTVVYNGPSKLELEDAFPFVLMPWIEGQLYPGISEMEIQNSPQMLQNLALAMLAANAIFKTHPKRVIVKDGIVKPDNNNPANVIEISEQAAAGRGLEELQPAGIGEAAKILLHTSKEDSYLVSGNDPVAHGAQPETLRSGVGVKTVIAASEVALYLTQDILYSAETRFFRITRDICRKVDYPQQMFVQNDMTGMEQPYQYENTLMNLAVKVEVSAEKEIDQEREELYSRALELKSQGDPGIDWELLHELSGIPPDIFERARQRMIAPPGPGARQIDQIIPGASGGAPALSVLPGGRQPAPAPGGGGAGMLGAARIRQETAGRNAPTQLRP